MKKLPQIIVALLIVASLSSCSKDESHQDVSLENVNVSYTQMDYEILELLNEYRINLGLSALQMINEASIEAEIHNSYMIEQSEVSHDNYGVRCARLRSVLNTKSIGENVAYGYTSAENVVRAWIQSEGHRNNIENSNYLYIGISSQKDRDAKNYFTNIFIEL